MGAKIGSLVPMTTLIQNGTVVTADSTTRADVLIEGEVIKEVRSGLAPNGAKVIDAAGMLRDPWRHRLPHAPRHAVRRHHFRRRFRNRNACRRVRRHHDAGRFRHPGPRHAHARRAGHLVEEGRGPRLHRLRAAHDRHRSGRLPASKTWTIWCARAWPVSSCSWPTRTC